MTVLDLLSADLFVALFVLIGWLVASRSASGMARRPGPAAIRRRATVALTAIVVSVSVVLVRVLLALALLDSGWWFVQETLVLGLPIQLVTAAAVLLLAVPRLRRLRRLAGQQAATSQDGAVAPTPELRLAAMHPLVLAPIRIALFGAIAAFLIVIVIGYPIGAADLAWVLLVLAAAGAVTSWLATRRWQLARGAGGVVLTRSPARRAIAVGLTLALTVAGVVTIQTMSMLPSEFELTDSAAHAHGASVESVSVADLRGVAGDGPVRRFTMVAARTTIRLPSGASIGALAFNQSVPGPEIRVTVGDTVEVTLRNTDVAEGVTLHWHGYPVPNGEDGVAGVTQDAVAPGGEFVYRFQATTPGTYWYHSHQQSHELVRRGLFGAFVVLPAAPVPAGAVDLSLPVHTFDAEGALNPTVILGKENRMDRLRVEPGSPVRLRMINSDGLPRHFALTGVTAVVDAVDGRGLNGPEPVLNPSIRVAGGGRVDFVFTMPTEPVLASVTEFGQLGLLLGAGDAGGRPPAGTHQEIDLLSYGERADVGIDRDSGFDKSFTLVLDQRIGFFDGRFDTVYTVNGQVFPDIPPQLVDEGDLIRFVFVNRSIETHPMHPHGTQVLVLSRDGKPATGSPVWMDTFDVEPGQTWEVAMRADNPGVWMDHCHNLRHASRGMMFHLAYRGVTSPFMIGHGAGNYPE